MPLPQRSRLITPGSRLVFEANALTSAFSRFTVKYTSLAFICQLIALL